MLGSVLSRLLVILILFAGGFKAVLAEANATITVTTTQDVIADDGQCSLREAIIAANTNSAYSNCSAGSGVDTIEFDPGLPLPAVFTLTKTGGGSLDDEQGDLDIRQSLIINGSGSSNIILDGNLTDRVFEIHPGAGTNQNPVTLNGITVRNGDPGSGAQGGGILVGNTARLALNNSLVTSNAASTCPAFCGGGVKLLGVVTVNNSTISSNHGGGLHNDEGILTLNNTQVLDNTGGYGVATRSGGYLYFTGGSVNNNQGGGIYIKDAHGPNLTNLTISGNTLGGGLHNESSALMTPSNFTLTDSVVTSNGATSGGGVLNMGVGASATIRNTTLSYNTATSGGGGLNNNGTLTLTGSTLHHNQARTGGGIDHNGPSVQLTNNTISHNSATDNGGGVYNRTTLSLLNLTLYGNSASGADTGGNIYNDGDSLAIKNTIVAGAGAGGNCFSNSGVINSGGHNLESTDTCGLAGTGDLVNTNPLLGPLQDNGGLTHTHALSVSSLAVNGGDDSGCPATDQRGVARPQGAACDIGAYEYIFDGPVDPFQIHLPLAYSG